MRTRTALLLPLLALAACRVDNNGSVRVEGICSPPTDPSSCSFSSTCSAQYIGPNTVDVSFGTSLWTVIQVNNLLPDNTNITSNKTNTNDAYVQEYAVQYDGVTLPDSSGPILGSAVVPAGGSTVISVLPLNVASTAGLVGSGQVPSEFIAKVKLKGVLGDTTKFETAEFQVPITVCNGCLASYKLACAAGTSPVYCPNQGQLPASEKCVTPQ
jgi:hypothetical protein